MEFLSNAWEWYTAGGASAWIAGITGILTAATLITAVTKTTVDNKIVNFLLKILNFAAGNVLFNKNKDDVG